MSTKNIFGDQANETTYMTVVDVQLEILQLIVADLDFLQKDKFKTEPLLAILDNFRDELIKQVRSDRKGIINPFVVGPGNSNIIN